MLRSLKTALVFAGALLVGASFGVISSVSPASADALPSVGAAQPMSELPPPPDDPKRKKAGEPCTSSKECQKHHSCNKVGEKKVCEAPSRHLPPGAVT